MSTRTITVFSTKGKQKAKIESEVKTWGELKPLVTAEGYDLNSLHATENVRRTDLNHVDGILPEGDFVLFLRPKKTKSGTEMSYKEVRNLIKSRKDEPGFIDHLNSTGDNYTRLKTEVLVELINEFDSHVDGPLEEEEIIEEEVSVNPNEPVTNLDRIETINMFLEEISDNSDCEFIEERVEFILDEVAALKQEIIDEEGEAPLTEEELAEQARIEAERVENERLEEEASNLFG